MRTTFTEMVRTAGCLTNFRLRQFARRLKLPRHSLSMDLEKSAKARRRRRGRPGNRGQFAEGPSKQAGVADSHDVDFLTDIPDRSLVLNNPGLSAAKAHLVVLDDGSGRSAKEMARMSVGGPDHYEHLKGSRPSRGHARRVRRKLKWLTKCHAEDIAAGRTDWYRGTGRSPEEQDEHDCQRAISDLELIGRPFGRSELSKYVLRTRQTLFGRQSAHPPSVEALDDAISDQEVREAVIAQWSTSGMGLSGAASDMAYRAVTEQREARRRARERRVARHPRPVRVAVTASAARRRARERQYKDDPFVRFDDASEQSEVSVDDLGVIVAEEGAGDRDDPSPLAWHPGEYLADELAVREWSAEDLAEKSGMPLEEVSSVLAGEADVTEGMANGLSRALAGFNRSSQHRVVEEPSGKVHGDN